MQIYADYNATAPMLPSAKTAYIKALDIFGNPSSVHSFGRDARHLLESSRRKLSDLLDIQDAEICFVSSGTEANHIVVRNLGDGLCLSTDHPSMVDNCGEVVSVDSSGIICLESLETRLKARIFSWFSFSLANSETGVVQPFSDIVKMCHAYNVRVHVDAVQVWGKLPLSFREIGADFMTVSGHKIGGGKGAAALIYKPQTSFLNLLKGGGQEKGIRSGTENSAAIAAMTAAAEQIDCSIWNRARVDQLKNKLLEVNPKSTFHSLDDGLPNTLCVSTPGISKDVQVIFLDTAGIAISAGSACSSGKVKQSHVLKAMNVADVEIESAVRISISPYFTQEDLDYFVTAWKNMQNNR